MSAKRDRPAGGEAVEDLAGGLIYSEDTAGTAIATKGAAPSYVARSIRTRRTFAELDALDDMIVDVVTEEHPVTLRGVFYRVMSLGAIEKSEAGYRVIGRQLVKLRRAGRIP